MKLRHLMKKRTNYMKIFTAIILLFILHVYANDDFVSVDERIRYILYQDSDVNEINFSPKYFAGIQFADDEKIAAIAFGRKKGWTYKVHGNILSIKPNLDAKDTNMIVFTKENGEAKEKRYFFEIKNVTKSSEEKIHNVVYWVNIVYPDKSNLDSVTNLKRIDANISTDQKKKIDNLLNVLNESKINTEYSYYIENMNADNAKFKPSKVLDDGMNTFFYFDTDLQKEELVYLSKFSKNSKIEIPARFLIDRNVIVFEGLSGGFIVTVRSKNATTRIFIMNDKLS